MPFFRLHQLALYLTVVAWLANDCFGMGILQRHETDGNESGGIRASRGHAGENCGRTAIIDFATGAEQSTNDPTGGFPVFGCRLDDDDGNESGGGTQ